MKEARMVFSLRHLGKASLVKRLSTASQAERRVSANVLRKSWSFKSTSMIGVGWAEL